MFCFLSFTFARLRLHFFMNNTNTSLDLWAAWQRTLFCVSVIIQLNAVAGVLTSFLIIRKRYLFLWNFKSSDKIRTNKTEFSFSIICSFIGFLSQYSVQHFILTCNMLYVLALLTSVNLRSFYCSFWLLFQFGFFQADSSPLSPNPILS